MALTKDQKRKKKLQARKAKQNNAEKAWVNKFNKERTIARNKIREDLRQRGLSEEKIQQLVPTSEDKGLR
jgi:Asp-tRNA(Asn)/Glu-tRNA(Gln) amidotransferase C subunit